VCVCFGILLQGELVYLQLLTIATSIKGNPRSVAS
jgi:hypothetical protein